MIPMGMAEAAIHDPTLHSFREAVGAVGGHQLSIAVNQAAAFLRQAISNVETDY